MKNLLFFIAWKLGCRDYKVKTINHPALCSKYVVCDAARSALLDCGPGYVYNLLAKVCEASNCKDNTTVKYDDINEEIQSKIKFYVLLIFVKILFFKDCINTGKPKIARVDPCNGFIKCATLERISCPSGQAFNETIQLCEDLEACKVKSSSAKLTFTSLLYFITFAFIYLLI